MPRGAQNPSHVGFVERDAPYDCAKCIHWHADNYQFPRLEGRHVEAWNVFLTVQDQQRIGMDAIGLDYGVLPAVFELLGIPRWRQASLFEELVILNHAHQAHRAEEREREAAAKRPPHA